jgi:hypothetical protein
VQLRVDDFGVRRRLEVARRHDAFRFAAQRQRHGLVVVELDHEFF